MILPETRRSDQHLLRADIGVVGGHVAAAIEIEGEAGDGRDQRQHHQQQEAAIAAQAGHQPAARLGRHFRALGRLGALLFGGGI
jgi:hypothetical protein